MIKNLLGDFLELFVMNYVIVIIVVLNGGSACFLTLSFGRLNYFLTIKE